MFFTDLETERLLLKNVAAEDAEFLFRQFTNDEVNRFLFDAEPFASVAEAKALIDFYTQDEPRNQHRWIITKKDTGEKIGTCGFHCWNREQRICELGYDLFPAYWGKGYMQEALAAILDFARNKMRMKQTEAHIAVGNTRSVRTAEKQGFYDSKETYMEIFRGKEYPHHIYIQRFD